MMAQRINGASKFNEDMPELAKVMATASTSLSKQIVSMKVDLAQLVSALEEIEVKTKQSIIQRILAWLEGFLMGLVFSVGPSKAPHQYVLGMVRIPSLSNLCREAAELCKKASENIEENKPETIESVLLFLKKTVPEEAQEVRKTLAQFDEAFVIRGLEKYMENVQTTTLPRRTLEVIAQQWSNVSGRCEQTLLDGQNPSSRSEK